MFQLSKCYIYFLPLHAQEERHEEAEETATKNQQEYGTVYEYLRTFPFIEFCRLEFKNSQKKKHRQYPC